MLNMNQPTVATLVALGAELDEATRNGTLRILVPSADGMPVPLNSLTGDERAQSYIISTARTTPAEVGGDGSLR
jgi:hypothetical protein